MVRGSPATWNVVFHIENDEIMAGKRKTGPECEESTEKSTPKRVGNGREGRNVKRHENEEESRGDQTPKRRERQTRHRNKNVSGGKCPKREENRESDDETGVEREETEKRGEKNTLERESESFRRWGSEEIWLEVLVNNTRSEKSKLP